jgi:hypothetical protein
MLNSSTRSISPMAQRRRSSNPIIRLFFDHRPMEHETSLFLLVSVLDFLMTWYMLRHQAEGFRFGESNAVARYFLHHWGLNGMLYFKLGMCLFIVLLTQIIHLRKPMTALGILWLGIVATSVTVIYSVSLYLRHAGAA